MSKVTHLLDQFDAGELSRPELANRLASLEYHPIEAAGQATDGSPDFPQKGTLEEIEAARLAERLTDDELEAVVVEVLNKAARA